MKQLTPRLSLNAEALDAVTRMQREQCTPHDQRIRRSAEVASTLTVFANLAGWRTAYNLASNGSQDLATPANDGVANLMKYAFGLDPLDAPATMLEPTGTFGMPRADTTSTDLLFSFVRRKSSASPGIAYTPQTSTALASWTDVTAAPTQLVDIDSV